MRPPLPHPDAYAIDTNTAASISRWILVRTFPTRKACENHTVPFFLIAEDTEGICAPLWNEAKIEVNPCKRSI
jgi:hypothetical protein